MDRLFNPTFCELSNVDNTVKSSVKATLDEIAAIVIRFINYF